jgi:hypothetical protein
MAHGEFIAGPNFSGRSQLLLARARQLGDATYFIGPYAEAALSGLSSTIADEIQIYRARSGNRDRPLLERPRAALRQKPQSLSGGEQVLLALHCFSISAYGSVAIDTALEQLDSRNRTQALDYLGSGRSMSSSPTTGRHLAAGTLRSCRGAGAILPATGRACSRQSRRSGRHGSSSGSYRSGTAQTRTFSTMPRSPWNLGRCIACPAPMAPAKQHC